MNFIDFVRTHDVGVFLEAIGNDVKWFWEINGGYHTCSSKEFFNTPEEAWKSLKEYLKTFLKFDE